MLLEPGVLLRFGRERVPISYGQLVGLFESVETAKAPCNFPFRVSRALIPGSVLSLRPCYGPSTVSFWFGRLGRVPSTVPELYHDASICPSTNLARLSCVGVRVFWPL